MQLKPRKPQNKYLEKAISSPSFWVYFFFSMIITFQEFQYYDWDIWKMIKDSYNHSLFKSQFQPYKYTAMGILILELIVYYFTEKALEVKTLAYTKENPYGEKKK